MQVILFYALLIGGIALGVAAYLAFIVTPVILIGHRFGLVAGAAFATIMAGVMYGLYKPPYGGVKLDFVPAGLQSNVYLVGLFNEPPVESLVAGAALATAGFAVVIAAWIVRRVAT